MGSCVLALVLTRPENCCQHFCPPITQLARGEMQSCSAAAQGGAEGDSQFARAAVAIFLGRPVLVVSRR